MGGAQKSKPLTETVNLQKEGFEPASPGLYPSLIGWGAGLRGPAGLGANADIPIPSSATLGRTCGAGKHRLWSGGSDPDLAVILSNR